MPELSKPLQGLRNENLLKTSKTSHTDFTLSSKAAHLEKIPLPSIKCALEITNTSFNDKVVYTIDNGIHYYPLVIFFKKKAPVFFPPEPHLNNGGHFSLSDAGVPPEVNLSARGQNEERENRKVWTPCSTSPALLLISTYMPRFSAPQAGESVISMN